MNSNLNQFDQAELIQLVGFLQETLQKKVDQLRKTKLQLDRAKIRLAHMKTTVEGQRQKILEHYR
jgi:hypothetical protein